MKNSKPLCYASRSPSDTESRYSNIEESFLLLVGPSLERLNHHIFRERVVIETDHKPLESIWKNTMPSASPWLQRLLLKMARYNVETRYIQGKTNVIANALSRVFCIEPPEAKDTKAYPFLKSMRLQTSRLPAQLN